MSDEKKQAPSELGFVIPGRMLVMRIIVSISLTIVALRTSAETRPSLEQTVAARLAGEMRECVKTNQGRWPTNWEQLQSGLQTCNDWLAAKGKGRVQALYVFVPTNFPVLERPEGRLILARYKPIMNGGLKGRYVVYQDPDEWVESGWVSDYDFDEMLAAFGSGLPLPSEPDNSPWAQLCRIAPVIILLLVAVFGVVGYRRLSSRRSRSRGDLS